MKKIKKGETTMATTQLATTQKTGLATYLSGDAVKKNISGVIGEKNTTRFISSVVSAVQANPALSRCTNASILSAALQGEALQLAPSPQLGQFYMVGFKNKKKVGNQWVEVEEAQFQMGWRGMVQLAIRSGQYRNIVVNDIREGEIDYNPITEEIDLHPIKDPAVRESTPIIGYYAMFELMNGFRKQMFSPIETIKAHASRYSRSYRYDIENGKKSSIWSTNFDAMAKKTMIRQLIGKWGIMSVEMQQAYTNDMGVIDDDGTVRYVDNPQTVEEQANQDIAENANSVEFDEGVAEVTVEPIPSETEAKPKKSATKAKKETATPPATDHIEEKKTASTPDYTDDVGDGPEWG